MKKLPAEIKIDAPPLESGRLLMWPYLTHQGDIHLQINTGLGRVLAVVEFHRSSGSLGVAGVVLCESAETLAQFCEPREDGGRYVVVWRSDRESSKVVEWVYRD